MPRKRAKSKFLNRPVEEYESYREACTNLSGSMRRHYVTYLTRFCDFVGKDPDEIVEERRRHLRSRDERVRRTYERKVLEFYEHVKKNLGVRETSAHQMVIGIRGWFARNYVRLEFGRRGPRRPKAEARDYVPTLGEVREIVECAGVRDKAIFLTLLQTGLAPVDVVELKRGRFERAIREDEYPALMAEVNREKTRVPAQICIGRDAGRAIRRYLDLRTDDSPYLFVELRRKKGEVQQLEPRFIDAAFQKAVKRSGVQVPNGLRLRVYSLRKIFETQVGKVIPQAWVDLLMGHSIAGARAAYIRPNDEELLEAYRKAEPLISISETKPTDRKIEALVSERTSELGKMVEARAKQLKTLVIENKGLKTKLKSLKGRTAELEHRLRTLEFLEARRLGLSVPELRELSTDQAEFISRIEREHPEWVSEE